MLLLESYVHRVRFAEILSRWMVNQPAIGDVRELKWIVNFNTYLIRIWLDHLIQVIFKELYGCAAEHRIVHHKGAIKDFLAAHPRFYTPRIRALLARYQRFPEDFYRDTPIDGGYYAVSGEDGPVFAGACRVKRFRRIAEKGSRRIVEFLLERIRASADDLAEERARSIGIPREQLLTHPAEQIEEFQHAERRVIKSIKRATIHRELPHLNIPDVAGAKIIAEREDYEQVVDLLETLLPCRVLEVEEHRGAYNAVNLRVRYTLPKEILAASPPAGRYLEVLAFRGFDTAEVKREYAAFLELAEPDVLFEIIVSSYEELLESEIGRSMHEERVLAQRAHPEYNGFLATNVRYLMNYVFSVCRSPARLEMTQVPLKLWVHYMPEAVDQLIQQLYVPSRVFFDTAVNSEG